MPPFLSRRPSFLRTTAPPSPLPPHPFEVRCLLPSQSASRPVRHSLFRQSRLPSAAAFLAVDGDVPCVGIRLVEVQTSGFFHGLELNLLPSLLLMALPPHPLLVQSSQSIKQVSFLSPGS
jgi:hypothetical protein